MAFFGGLDTAVLSWINGYVGRSAAIDDAVRVLADWNFARSILLGCFVLGAWFKLNDRDSRLKIVAGLAGLLAATGLSRLLQVAMPLHARPFNSIDEFGLNVPRNLDTHWGFASSFPSDTATLYFALAAIIYSLSRAWGIAAFVWVATVIALPRVYILYHWPSDIVAGLALGIACVAIAQHFRNTVPQFDKAVMLEKLEPQLFYPVLFVLLYQIVDSFAAVELVLHEISALGKHLAGSHEVARAIGVPL